MTLFRPAYIAISTGFAACLYASFRESWRQNLMKVKARDCGDAMEEGELPEPIAPKRKKKVRRPQQGEAVMICEESGENTQQTHTKKRSRTEFELPEVCGPQQLQSQGQDNRSEKHVVIPHHPIPIASVTANAYQYGAGPTINPPPPPPVDPRVQYAQQQQSQRLHFSQQELQRPQFGFPQPQRQQFDQQQTLYSGEAMGPPPMQHQQQFPPGYGRHMGQGSQHFTPGYGEHRAKRQRRNEQERQPRSTYRDPRARVAREKKRRQRGPPPPPLQAQPPVRQPAPPPPPKPPVKVLRPEGRNRSILEYNNYVLCYDNATKSACWTLEHITSENTNCGNRSSPAQKLREDIRIPRKFKAEEKDYLHKQLQTLFLVDPEFYPWDKDDIYVVPNVLPQVRGRFNMWRDFNQYIKGLARVHSNLYICSGPLYVPERKCDGKYYVNYQLVGENKVAVPSHFFKVIVGNNPDGTFRCECFKISNKGLESDDHIKNYIVSREEIEKDAGFRVYEHIKPYMISQDRCELDKFKPIRLPEPECPPPLLSPLSPTCEPPKTESTAAEMADPCEPQS